MILYLQYFSNLLVWKPALFAAGLSAFILSLVLYRLDHCVTCNSWQWLNSTDLSYHVSCQCDSEYRQTGVFALGLRFVDFWGHLFHVLFGYTNYTTAHSHRGLNCLSEGGICGLITRSGTTRIQFQVIYLVSVYP